jgi:hypothetical protein
MFGTNQNKQKQVNLIGISLLGVACTQKIKEERGG